MADAIARAGYPVVGSLTDLVPGRRSAGATTRAWPPPDADLLAAAEAALYATLARLADGSHGHDSG